MSSRHKKGGSNKKGAAHAPQSASAETPTPSAGEKEVERTASPALPQTDEPLSKLDAELIDPTHYSATIEPDPSAAARPDAQPLEPKRTEESASASATADQGGAGNGTKAPNPDSNTRQWNKRWILTAVVFVLLLGAVAAWQTAKWAVNTRPIPYTPVEMDAKQTAALTGSEPNADGEQLIDRVRPDVVTITVRDGDTSMNVAAALRAQGYDLPNWLMKLAARMHPNTLNRLHKGRYRFPTKMTPAAMLDTLGRGALVEGVIRIPEGATLWEVRALFDAATGLTHDTRDMSEEELAQALDVGEKNPEGFLAPDTYHYAEGVSDLQVMRLAVKRQHTLLTTLWEGRSPSVQLKSPYDALILASIIERESGLEADRGKISSVFHNRLAKSMPLQTDPTVIYGLGPSFNGNLTKKDLASETPYNTYRIAALPPTPIGAPGKSALKAALNPDDTPYLYFVSRGDGSSEFSTNLNAHNRAVNRYILQRPKDNAKSAAPASKASSSKPARAQNKKRTQKSEP